MGKINPQSTKPLQFIFKEADKKRAIEEFERIVKEQNEIRKWRNRNAKSNSSG